MQVSLTLALSLLAAAPFAQGQTWVVDDDGGPGVDFTDIQPAVSAAGDGDVILVKDGVYGGFFVNGKSLTVCADDGADVSVELIQVYLLSADDVVCIQGVHSDERTNLDACQVWDSEGLVWIEDCLFRPAQFAPPAYALRIENSNAVVLKDVNAFGANGTLGGWGTLYGPGTGVYVEDSTLVAFGLQSFGGGGASYSTTPSCSACAEATDGGPGLFVKGTSSLHLSGSYLQGGGGPVAAWSPIGGSCIYGDGGPGLRSLDSSPAIALQGCVLQGGPPGGLPFVTYCPQESEAGPEFDLAGAALEQITSQPMTMSANSPLREGASLDLSFHGPAQSAVLLGVADAPLAFPAVTLGAPLAIAPSAFVLPVGVTSTAGVLTASFPLFDMPPGIEATTWFGQAAYLDPAGGGSLGEPGLLVLLDASF